MRNLIFILVIFETVFFVTLINISVQGQLVDCYNCDIEWSNEPGCSSHATCASSSYALEDCGGACFSYSTSTGWGARAYNPRDWNDIDRIGTCGDGIIQTGETCEPPGYFLHECKLTGKNYLLNR